MFDRLDLSKIMYFKNKNPGTFKFAMDELADKIGIPDASPQQVEERVLNALKNVATQLNANKESNTADYKVLLAFHTWTRSIHNNDLIPPAGARFPNNIVYDMLTNLRNNKQNSNEHVLLLFFLEGTNARKIKNGTPDNNFIATTLMIATINALKNMAIEPSAASSNFMKKYANVCNYVDAQQKIVKLCTQLKNEDPLYGFISANELFDFKRSLEKSGANAYFLDNAITEISAFLEKHPEYKETSKIENMVNNVKLIYPQIIEALESAKNNSNEESHLLGIWDASEWIARLYTALCVGAQFDSRYQPDLDFFMANPLLADIIRRGKTGDFPVNERNDDLDKVEIREIYAQDMLAKQALLSPKSGADFKFWNPDNSEKIKTKSTFTNDNPTFKK